MEHLYSPSRKLCRANEIRLTELAPRARIVTNELRHWSSCLYETEKVFFLNLAVLYRDIIRPKSMYQTFSEFKCVPCPLTTLKYNSITCTLSSQNSLVSFAGTIGERHPSCFCVVNQITFTCRKGRTYRSWYRTGISNVNSLNPE